MPLLGVEDEMVKALESMEDHVAFSAWIRDNVEEQFHSSGEFVFALFSAVLKRINDSDLEVEKEKLSKFRHVLQSFVANRGELQLTAVYALQVFCHSKGFPKGLLLRTFVNCYEMDILEESAFLKWKEDVNDSYEGKGKALFQVN